MARRRRRSCWRRWGGDDGGAFPLEALGVAEDAAVGFVWRDVAKRRSRFVDHPGSFGTLPVEAVQALEVLGRDEAGHGDDGLLHEHAGIPPGNPAGEGVEVPFRLGHLDRPGCRLVPA